MIHSQKQVKNAGMTLVEVVFAAALLLLVFGAIMSAFQTITSLIGSSKAQAGAVALANEKMEYIRSLSYDSVGTISGIPNGPIPQTSSKSLNGIAYTERVLIEYIDDPKDGTGASDSNAILADYKLAKVTYSWYEKGNSKSISLLSNIVPRGIETSTGGGTLRVNVFDAKALPVSGASVRVYNNTGTSSLIDTIRYTNTAGVAIFSGAPARSGYQITATNVGYSTDQTYSASTTNPNPVTPHVAVLKNQVSTMNFQIDVLSNLTINVQDVPITNSFEDVLSDMTKVATSSRIAVSGGVASLSSISGNYVATGTLISTTITPNPLLSWDSLSYEALVPSGTTMKVHIYGAVGTSTPILLPNSVLSNNSLGFTPGSISLKTIPVATYPTLVLKANLYSSSSSATPALSSWKVGYTNSKTVLVGVPVSITGAKKISANASAPVYKYIKSLTTNSSGSILFSNIEWGVYDIQVSASYSVAEACKNIPYILGPGLSKTVTLNLTPAAAQSLRVTVVDTSGYEVPNASLTLSNGGFNQSKITSACGQTFFGSGVSVASDYSLTASAFGYTTQTITPISIAGNEVLVVTLIVGS